MRAVMKIPISSLDDDSLQNVRRERTKKEVQKEKDSAILCHITQAVSICVLICMIKIHLLGFN